MYQLYDAEPAKLLDTLITNSEEDIGELEDDLKSPISGASLGAIQQRADIAEAHAYRIWTSTRVVREYVADLMTIDQTSQKVAMPPRSLWYVINAGELKCIYIGADRYLHAEDVEAWLKKNYTGNYPAAEKFKYPMLRAAKLTLEQAACHLSCPVGGARGLAYTGALPCITLRRSSSRRICFLERDCDWAAITARSNM